MFVQQFFIEGLGCASYLLAPDAYNVAAVIDPDRDVSKYMELAAAHGYTITHIIETHLHADHVSGNTELAARTGATIYIHSGAGVGYPHADLNDGDILKLGNLKISILHTPGHTPESITLLVADESRGSEPALALTGDTLFVGDVGRPDLVGAAAARDLAAALHDSLNRKILALPDSLLVYPGHGAGSLCGRALGAMRVSTLGYERHLNPALEPRARDEFINFATADLPEQPANSAHIKALNRQGPPLLGEIFPRPLTLDEALYQFQRGAGLLDTRAHDAYVAAHIPGGVHLEANDQLSNRVGLVIPPQVPLVLLLDVPADYPRVVYMLARVGMDRVVGYLASTLQEWEARGLPLVSGDIQDVDSRELQALLEADQPPVVVDVRETWEYRSGHIPGAKLVPLAELQARAAELDPEQPVAVVCESGSRSQTGAAILAQKGFKKIYNLADGTGGWRRHGFLLER